MPKKLLYSLYFVSTTTDFLMINKFRWFVQVSKRKMKKKKKKVLTLLRKVLKRREQKKKKRIYLICDARYRKKVSFIMCSRKIVSLTYKKKKLNLSVCLKFSNWYLDKMVVLFSSFCTDDLSLYTVCLGSCCSRVYWREIKIFAHDECKWKYNYSFPFAKL